MNFHHNLGTAASKRRPQNPNLPKLEVGGFLIWVTCYYEHAKNNKIACVAVECYSE